MQSKRRSAYEAIANIFVGLVYAFIINYALLHVTWSNVTSQAFWMTIWFTLASFIRQYVMRRLFNWWDIKYPTFEEEIPNASDPYA